MMDNNKRILLVEDDELWQSIIRAMLQHRGFSVDVFGVGEGAIGALEEADPRYSLVILDMYLPGMDGGIVYKQIRDSSHSGVKDVPIIVITAMPAASTDPFVWNDPAEAVRFRRLRKSAITDTLVPTINDLLSLKDASQEKLTLTQRVERSWKRLGLCGDRVDALALADAFERNGYKFAVADGSLEALIARACGVEHIRPFAAYKVYSSGSLDGGHVIDANVKVEMDGEVLHAVGEGSGPIDALMLALKKAMIERYPKLANLQLVDFRVGPSGDDSGSNQRVRVMITWDDHISVWRTMGVSANIIEATWHALVDGFECKLISDNGIRCEDAAAWCGDREDGCEGLAECDGEVVV